MKIVNHNRFYQSLITNLDARLKASPDIRELLDEIDVVDPNKRPSSVESPWLEGEAKVKNYVNVLVWKVLLSSEQSCRDYVDEPARPHEISQSIIHTLQVSTVV